MNRRTFLRGAVGTALAAGVGAGGAFAFLRQEAFGALPEGSSRQRVASSPHYVDGEFRNVIPRPILSDGSSFVGALIRSLTEKRVQTEPPVPVPSKRPDLRSLDRSRDCVVWLGHSTFFLQLEGRRLLIDPVFSEHASPVSFSIRAFAGATPCAAADMPDIDCLLISHDHWDHLDYPTVMTLKNRVRTVICGLGVGAHFRRWGFSERVLREADWGETVAPNDDLRITLVTASHYSGRALTRNQSLWTGFRIVSPRQSVFFSGDSGYGPHFADVRKAFGPTDLALLDCGQYNARWKYIHMTPEEAARAAEDLGAGALLPAHVGKFALASHPWDEPFRRVSLASRNKNFSLLTPVIGDVVPLSGAIPVFPRWWENERASTSPS
ncbi:MBL fold metallo-hydrolase [Mailhella sp.]|uniref:MBL fold metallo-hydrolase n=1 Tax=Mailhella sp. TaxID=1981029 RepID=UPI003AB395F5